MMISRLSTVVLVASVLAGLPLTVWAADTPAKAPAGAPPAAAAPAQAAAPASAPSRPLPPTTIMIVDVQRIMQEATAAKGVTTAVEAQRDTYQKEIEGLETKLRAAEQDLVKQKTVLSADAFNKKQGEFQKQVADLQRTVQTRKRALDTALDGAMTKVQRAMVEIVEEIASEKGITLVMARHLFIIHATDFDQTDVVLKRLNERLPKVEVTIPKQ